MYVHPPIFFYWLDSLYFFESGKPAASGCAPCHIFAAGHLQVFHTDGTPCGWVCVGGCGVWVGVVCEKTCHPFPSEAMSAVLQNTVSLTKLLVDGNEPAGYLSPLVDQQEAVSMTLSSSCTFYLPCVKSECEREGVCV